MLYLTTFALTRRVLLPSVALRLVFTRFISSTPTFYTPAKVSATKASAPKKAAKASAKPKAKVEKKKKKEKKTVKAEKKPTVKRADMIIPKRAHITGWIYFTKSSLAGANKTVEEVQREMKHLADKWKSMTETEQKPFHDQAREQNEKRVQQFEEWKKTVDPAVVQAINKKRKAGGKRRIRLPNTGPGKPLSSFIRYAIEFQKQDSSMTYSEALKRAGAAWRDLSEEGKRPYAEAYMKDYQAYLKQTSASQAH